MKVDDLVTAPLRRCEVLVTPGYMHLHVVNTKTKEIIEGVTKIDLDADLVWIWFLDRSFEHPCNHELELRCRPEILEQFRREWLEWK